MSADLCTIYNTGVSSNRALQITEFYSPNGSCIQLTQGFGLSTDEPGFVQLNKRDIVSLVAILEAYLRSNK